MRIFVEPTALAAGELVVRGDEHHYLARVRRARAGDTIELVDGAGRRATAVIARITDTETALTVNPPEAIAARPPLIRALLPLIKGDRMDTALEKLVEVGVDAIVLWPAERAVVRLEPDRRDARLAKYTAALQAAARQSGRAQVPSIAWADSITAAAAHARDAAFVLDPTSDAPLPASITAATDVTIISGPEGGLSPAELACLPHHFAPLGLGPRVLRAETAPVIAVALLRAATGS